MEREETRPVGKEVITPWVKSSYSDTGANCVEVARTASGMVAVRDSKEVEGSTLTFTVEEWGKFVGSMKGDEFGGLKDRRA